MKLVALAYKELSDLLKNFKPEQLTERSKITNQGTYLVVEGLDDFRGFVANARIGIYVVYKTLRGRSAGSVDSQLDSVLKVLLENNIEINRVSLVSSENGSMIYRIEIAIDVGGEQ